MNLKKCHYCGNEAKQTTHPDLNVVGKKGYKSTIKCTLCNNQVETWAKSYDEAVKKSAFYWNGG